MTTMTGESDLAPPATAPLPTAGPAARSRDDDDDDRCAVCGDHAWNYVMNAHGLTFFACENCRLMRLHPPPSAKTLAAIEKQAGATPTFHETSAEELARVRAYWLHLRAQLSAAAGGGSGCTPEESRVLLFSSRPEPLLQVGGELGFRHIEVFSADAALRDGGFDACLAVFALERLADPTDGLARLHRLLRPGGRLLLVAPLLDSWPARFCRTAWPELRPENRFYFSTHTLRTLLLRHGFHRLWFEPDRRRYSLAHLVRQARVYPSTWLTRSLRTLGACVPATWFDALPLPLPTSAFLLSATKKSAPTAARPKLSIVMPAFNEMATFEECFTAVQAKEVGDMDKEIIVVESNSRDGTRELAQRLCAGQGNVQLILQDRAAGKGNAVRAGLAAVTGDIVLIQDADLEYDVNDYDELVKPILQGRAAFVLGSRHSGSWKLRKFNDQPLVATFFNLGHLFFCASINWLYGQSLKDPFTMYKVFQTDCLHGLEFECNRFDFDFEILIKLLRKGYQPIELPVNYQARSLNEGKKVTAVRDPLTWLRALVKFRFCRIGPPREDAAAAAPAP